MLIDFVPRASAAYLSRFVHSIEQKNQAPFPSKNMTYNYKGTNGFVLPVRLCLVGVVTCDDHIVRKVGSSSMNSILNLLGENRFLLTDPSSSTRLAAYQHAFASLNVRLSPECIDALPILAAKATSSRGKIFIETAKALLCMIGSNSDEASLEQIEKAMQKVMNLGDTSSSKSRSAVSFQSSAVQTSDEKDPGIADVFSSVGGNLEAKRALVDALALDERKRRRMALWGMATPSGVLLYGPPGTPYHYTVTEYLHVSCENY